MISATRIEDMELTRDLAKIEEQWDALFGLLDRIERGDMPIDTRRESVSAWSVGQQLGHTALVLIFIADQIENLLTNPAQNVGDDLHPLADMLLKGGQIPRGRGVAPDFVRVERPEAGAIRAQLELARTRWRALAAKAGQMASTPSRFPHHHLGPMTSAQWTRFIAIHTAHHLLIIRDILGEPGR